MREFSSAEMIPDLPAPETKDGELERERDRKAFLGPAKAFQDCSRELFVSGTLDHTFIDQAAGEESLTEEYRFALYGFADSARKAGAHVDLLLAEHHRETGSYEPDDKLLAQKLLKFTPRYDCTVEPNELGFSVVFTHPADYLQWYWGTERFLYEMSKRVQKRGIPTDDLTTLPRALYYHVSTASQRYDEANNISILTTHIDPKDPEWRTQYLQHTCHEWRHAVNQILIPKVGEAAHAHERSQDMMVWALQSTTWRRAVDDTAYEYLRALKEYGQFALVNELLAKSGNPQFSKHEAIDWLTHQNHGNALYDYYGKSTRTIFEKALPHGTHTEASRALQSRLTPRIREMQQGHIETVHQLVSSFDAVRVRLRLNPDNLYAGMAMQATTCDRFDDFMDRVKTLAGQ